MKRRAKLSFFVEYCDSEITAEKIALQLQEYIDDVIPYPEKVDYLYNCTVFSISNFQIESDE